MISLSGSTQGDARPGAGRKKIGKANSKQLGTRISEDRYDRCKELKILRRVNSDAELFGYLLDLAASISRPRLFFSKGKEYPISIYKG